MSKRRVILAVLLVIVALAVWLTRRGGDTDSSAAAARRATREQRDGDTLARIDLARLQLPRAEASVGRRDLFDFAGQGRSSPQPAPDPGPPNVRPAIPGTSAGPAGTVPPVTSAEPARVTYIGSLQSGRGLKVAVLLTDDEEVLTGQVGELVANRFRIVSIGIESVDIQDVGSARVRRIPLKGS